MKDVNTVKPGYYVAYSKDTVIFVRVRHWSPYIQLVTFDAAEKLPHPKNMFAGEFWFSTTPELHTDYKRISYRGLVALVAANRLTR